MPCGSFTLQDLGERQEAWAAPNIGHMTISDVVEDQLLACFSLGPVPALEWGQPWANSVAWQVTEGWPM